MKNLLPLALTYLNKGWSVIPVAPDKRPLIQWKEYQTRKATPEELVNWWTQYPDAQVGIVTGQISNLTVIDIESGGDFNLVNDETYTVATGGGGRHIYHTFDKDFKNAVRILPNVDIRSEGGYVVAAGSTTSKGAYSVLKDLEMTQMSAQTKKTLLGTKSSYSGAAKALPWYATPVETQYPKLSTTGLEYTGNTEGSRNDSMTKYAGAIIAKLHPSLWPTIGWKLFEEANQKNTPPLIMFELRTIWASITTRESHEHPGGRDYSPDDSQGKSSKTWGPAPEKAKDNRAGQGFKDSLADDESEDDEAEKEKSKETLHASEVASLQVIDSDHTYPVDMPPLDEALLGGFSAGELIVVAGQSGHGKTTLIQDWSVTLSSGGQSNREKLPSLWFSYEVLAKPLWQKFQVMGANIDTPIYMPRFNETGEMEWVVDVIERAIVKWGIKVVCIDHLGFLRAPKGNYSNAADAVTNTVRALKKLAVKRGLIILLPVHVRKTASKTPDLNDVRDSLGIAQEADTVFFIGREKDDSGLPTQQAKVWLVKNRKTGISVSAMLDYQFGRYYYNAGESKSILSVTEKEKQDAHDPLKEFNDWGEKKPDGDSAGEDKKLF